MSDDRIDDILTDSEIRMVGAVEHTQESFGKIRTGRANPQLVTDLPVEYYGTPTPLQQLASVSVPEPRMLLINPFDRSSLKEVERAIANADLGLNPNSDGQVIRVVFPELTEERRREYVKVARERAEEGRVSVRNIRRSAKNEFSKLENDGDVPEDEVQRAEKRLQDLTDKHVAKIDGHLENKEAELLEV